MRRGNEWRRRQAPLSGSGSLTCQSGGLVDKNRRIPSSPPQAVPGQATRKGGDVYIGIGTVLAIIVIILLLIWIF